MTADLMIPKVLVQSSKGNKKREGFSRISQLIVESEATGGLNPDVETLGQLVKHHRERLGLTQGDLGKMIGVDGQTISNLERGKTRTLLKGKLRSLAQSLSLPIEQVVEASKRSAAVEGGGDNILLTHPYDDAIRKAAEALAQLEKTTPAEAARRALMRIRFEESEGRVAGKRAARK